MHAEGSRHTRPAVVNLECGVWERAWAEMAASDLRPPRLQQRRRAPRTARWFQQLLPRCTFKGDRFSEKSQCFLSEERKR